MEEPAVVRKLGVEIVTDATTAAQFVDGDFSDFGDELRVEYLVDSAAVLIQGFPFRFDVVRVTAGVLSKQQRGWGTG